MREVWGGKGKYNGQNTSSSFKTKKDKLGMSMYGFE